ncbi:unnamed protein product [Hyaloperonospora brassicae]|uniref:C2H2-type domain-containing protein n=1 Tax=Hyaloperonospora brassicae TaxID=162125 RepID=A0AAV0UKX6_HYABA|nr:unnamed protein product [Hyaloperonospora brassicae]
MPDSPPRSCPVCAQSFAPPASASSFALHVVSCSSFTPASPSAPASPSSPSASSTPSHCTRCLHVYAASARAHEKAFHEHECARVNADEQLPDRRDDAPDGPSAATRSPKRQRHDRRASPVVSLFPCTCFLCGLSGRNLLHCGGSCARAAHLNA